MDSDHIQNQYNKELEELRVKKLYRAIRVLKEHEGTRAVFEGRKILLFCGNDYFGMSRHPRVIATAHQALDRYGVGARSARLIAGTTEAHERLEQKIAEFKNKEKALVFGAGFLANLGILASFAGKNDVVIMDKLCHASLIDGARLSGAGMRVFPHKNYEKCEEILKKSEARRKILVTENVFGMDGDRAGLKELIHLKKKYGALLVVDDAHGTGLFGKEDPGSTAAFSGGIDVIMGTLSKAVGGLGGFVAANRVLIDHLINFARPFIFATALPPVLCEAAREGLCVIEEEKHLRKKLWENIRHVHRVLLETGFSIPEPESAILPVILGDEGKAVEAFEKMLARGIFIPAVRYPTVPRGKARLRITVSAAHEERDIIELKRAFSALKNSGEMKS